MKKSAYAAVALLSLSSALALADDANQRMENQQKRIDQGVQNGSMTQGEAKRAEAQHDRIQNSINRDEAKHGGTLTPAEQKRINQRENRASRNIRRKKHNGKYQ